MVRMINEQRQVGNVPVIYKQQAKSENNWQFRNKWPISLPKFHENRLSVDKRNLVIEKISEYVRML